MKAIKRGPGGNVAPVQTTLDNSRDNKLIMRAASAVPCLGNGQNKRGRITFFLNVPTDDNSGRS